MKLSIGHKLFGAFGIIIVLLIVFSAYVMSDLNEFKEDVSSYSGIAEEISTAQELQLNVANVWQFLTDASLTRDAGVIEEEARPNYVTANSTLEKLIQQNQNEPKHLAMSHEIKTNLAEMWNVGEKMFAAYGVSPEAGNVLMGEYDAVSANVLDGIASIVSDMTGEGTEAVAEMNEMVDSSLGVAKGVLALLAIISICIGIFLVRLRNSITRPLTDLAAATHKVAEGDLSITMEDKGIKGEMGDLSRDFIRMLTNLKAIIAQVKNSVGDLSSASHELNATGVQITAGTEAQNSRATQVATATQEMSSTITEIVKNVSDAASEAQDACDFAKKGGDIVTNTIQSMSSIASTARESSEIITDLGASSDEIGKIVSVINDIADQTNLLALNAAIEAARAGEQGRGFAVVADEVRGLAERTQTATKEIGDMISEMQAKTTRAITSMENEVKAVEEGVNLATEAGDALDGIVGKVGGVTDRINQISTASEEQSVATEQISQDIGDVAAVVEQTSQGAENLATLGNQIDGLATTLEQMVSKFKLAETSIAHAPNTTAKMLKTKSNRTINKDIVIMPTRGQIPQEADSNAAFESYVKSHSG